jgi:FMN-dependent NADH-azoreductase
MTKLLVVETSPRGDHSISRNMTRRFVAEWQTAHPDGEVVERDLIETDLKFIDAPWLQAYFTPPEQQSPEMKAELDLSDELVGELLACDHLVIATPVYNYNVPAKLKAWIDSIVRKGLTLGFDGKGLVTGKTATVLMATGALRRFADQFSEYMSRQGVHFDVEVDPPPPLVTVLLPLMPFFCSTALASTPVKNTSSKRCIRSTTATIRFASGMASCSTLSTSGYGSQLEFERT